MNSPNVSAAANVLPMWPSRLKMGRSGPENCLSNAMLLLENDPAALAFRKNDFTLFFETKDPDSGRWRNLRDHDYALARLFLEDKGLRPGPELAVSAVHAVAEKQHTHPVRDYLRSLHWDGTPRLERLFTDYFKSNPTTLNAEIGKRFAIGAVARIFSPGCKLDNYPVLEGAQGIKKSTGLKALAGTQWFSDTRIDINRGADAYMALQGVWIYEVAELDAFKGVASTRLKSFVSSASDRFRAPYGRTVQDIPRQSIFAATTNDSDYVTDWTGERRKWPVAVAEVDVAAIERDRDQLWAEAQTLYDAGERWHLEGAAAIEIQEETTRRYDQDVLIEEMAECFDREKFPAEVSFGEICKALNFESQKGGNREQSRVIRALKTLGFAKTRAAKVRGAVVNLWETPDVFRKA